MDIIPNGQQPDLAQGKAPAAEHKLVRNEEEGNTSHSEDRDDDSTDEYLAKTDEDTAKTKEARARVREEIMNLIKPYRESNKEPQFSAPELIVMALLSTTEPWLLLNDILRWIITTFKCYKEMALDDYASFFAEDSEYAQVPEVVIEGFHKAFDCWKAPLYNPNGTIVVEPFNGYTDGTYMHVMVPVAAGRIFLRRWLEPERKGKFPFLRLPAELRNTIYQMVFTFPKSGIYVGPRPLQGRGVELLQREDEEYSEHCSWEDDPDSTLGSPPLQEVLALLSVNKQVYKEAMPFFYQINHFYCENPEAFMKFGCGVGQERFQHLRDIHINCGTRYRAHVGDSATASEKLAQLKFIKKLEVNIHEVWWFNMPKWERQQYGRSSKYTKAEQLPGMKNLAIAATKAKVFSITGDCPRIKEYLESEREKATKTEGVVENAKPAKKRKSQSSKDESGGPAKKRSKAAK